MCCNKLRISLFILSIFVWTCSRQADEMKGMLSIGAQYPGLNVRYFVSDKVSMELKGMYETDATALGLRGSYYFNSGTKYVFFTGLEADYVTFKGEVSEGSGFALEPFVGIEYFFGKNISFQADFGTALINIEDKNIVAASITGLEYVVNIGINFFLKGRRGSNQ